MASATLIYRHMYHIGSCKNISIYRRKRDRIALSSYLNVQRKAKYFERQRFKANENKERVIQFKEVKQGREIKERSIAETPKDKESYISGCLSIRI